MSAVNVSKFQVWTRSGKMEVFAGSEAGALQNAQWLIAQRDKRTRQIPEPGFFERLFERLFGAALVLVIGAVLLALLGLLLSPVLWLGWHFITDLASAPAWVFPCLVLLIIAIRSGR